MALQNPDPRLVLASRSAARVALLAGAGLRFDIVPANIDEAQLRASLGNVSPQDVAQRLALTKALHVSALHPDALVIGADQVLGIAGDILAKPHDRSAAARQLALLAGKTHTLFSACACAQGSAVVWQGADDAAMSMRALSEAFIDDYLDGAGEGVLASVGAYQLEGLGSHLFSAVDGDYFTILGLPLLKLLAFLRTHGVIAA